MPALVSAGAAPYNLLHQQPASVTGERQPGDEVFDTLAARRPVLEAVLRELVAPEQRIELRHGCTVDALAMNADRSAVTGLRVGACEVAADLVIDAAGARGPVRGWLAEATGRPLVRPPAENRLTYVGRWFEATTPPPRLGPLLVNHPSWSLLTLPSDGGAYAVVLVVGSRDRAARDLHDPERWTAAVRCDPVGAAWIDHGRPVTPVEVHGGFDRGDGQTASREPSLESCAPEWGGCRIHHPADTGISRSSSAFGLADHFRVATRKRTLKPKASGDLEIPDPGPPLGVTTTGSVLAVQGEPAERPRHQVRSCSSTRAAARTSAR